MEILPIPHYPKMAAWHGKNGCGIHPMRLPSPNHHDWGHVTSGLLGEFHSHLQNFSSTFDRGRNVCDEVPMDMLRKARV